jgi:alpha-D-xyloside xylohydrolase
VFYLPVGEWLRFCSQEPAQEPVQKPSQKAWQGGKVYKLTLALDELAVFVPVGQKIPMGAAVQHTELLDDNNLVSHYWPDGE